MRKFMTAGMALALSLAVAGTAQANTVVTDFDGQSWTTGSVNGQNNWTSGPFDQEVVDLSDGNGGRSLRISNGIVAGSFDDMPHSAPVDPAGENVDNDIIVQSFDFHSASESIQPGLSMSISPTDQGGTRMNYVRLEDRFDGIRVYFDEANSTDADPEKRFTEKLIATLDRTQNHRIIFVTKFIDGGNNDIAAVYVDDAYQVCGASWENYYRLNEQRNPTATDRLMWRLRDGANTMNGGFIFDNVVSTSYEDDQGYDCAPNLPSGPAGPEGPAGPQGPKGDAGTNGVNGSNGTNGANGKDGVSTTRTLRGASIRHLHVRKITGMKFLSAKATMGGKRLSVNGRTVTVDLRGKGAGRYRVHTSAKYTANGKTFTVNRFRYLRVLSK